MDNTTTTVLYALSTIAQTCAALAAFVGAVGLFRLQLLRIKQDTAERDLRGLASRAGLESSDLAALTPIRVIADRVEKADAKQGGFVPSAKEALKVWSASPHAFRPSRNALIWFEVWNLAVSGLTLIGFAFVPTLARFSGVSAVLLCL